MRRKDKDIIKKRQSEASKTGRKTEEEVKNLLLNDKKIYDNFLIVKPSDLSEEERSPLYINYGENHQMIDADICVIRKTDKKLSALFL